MNIETLKTRILGYRLAQIAFVISTIIIAILSFNNHYFIIPAILSLAPIILNELMIRQCKEFISYIIRKDKEINDLTGYANGIIDNMKAYIKTDN